MEGIVFALLVLKDMKRSVRNIPEPEFQRFNLAALRLPKDPVDTTRGAKANRQPALTVSAAY